MNLDIPWSEQRVDYPLKIGCFVAPKGRDRRSTHSIHVSVMVIVWWDYAADILVHCACGQMLEEVVTWSLSCENVNKPKLDVPWGGYGFIVNGGGEHWAAMKVHSQKPHWSQVEWRTCGHKCGDQLRMCSSEWQAVMECRCQEML